MGLSINKNGIISTSNFIEQEQFSNSKISFFKNINKNIVSGRVDITTNKNGTVSSVNTLGAISADIVKSLAGKTVCCSYEVHCPGVRYSAEQGQTAYNYIRYGIHAGVIINSNQYWPFGGDNLNYSGSYKRFVMNWTFPSSITTCGDFTFAVQNFDKPASTNNETWFLRNLKLEIGSYATPFCLNDIEINEDDTIQAREIIEI